MMNDTESFYSKQFVYIIKTLNGFNWIQRMPSFTTETKICLQLQTHSRHVCEILFFLHLDSKLVETKFFKHLCYLK